MQIQVSFIVVTYQRGELLTRCLASIYAQEELPAPVEVIVVDNGGDAVVPAPPDDRFLLRVERPGRNLGVAGGRNKGMGIASGEYLLFVDDDAEWDSPLDACEVISLFSEQPACGAVALMSRTPGGELIVAELPHPNKSYLAHQANAVEVPYFYGVAHALRASVIRRTGSYPERYLYAMEELDLSLRIIDAGYTILYRPTTSVVHHKSSAGRPFVNARYWITNALNKARVAFRLLPLQYCVSICLIWSAAVLVKTRQPSAVMAVWRALWAERHLLRQERRVIQPHTLRYLRRIGARLLY